MQAAHRHRRKDSARTYHLCHELQKRGPPQPAEQVRVPEEREPAHAGAPVLLDVAAYTRKLEVDLLVREALLAQPVQRAQGLVIPAMLYQPAGPGCGGIGQRLAGLLLRSLSGMPNEIIALVQKKERMQIRLC